MTVYVIADRMLVQMIQSDLITCILQIVKMEEYEQYPSLKIVDECGLIHHPTHSD